MCKSILESVDIVCVASVLIQKIYNLVKSEYMYMYQKTISDIFISRKTYKWYHCTTYNSYTSYVVGFPVGQVFTKCQMKRMLSIIGIHTAIQQWENPITRYSPIEDEKLINVKRL